MTTTEPDTADRREYCGYHLTWCTNHDDESPLHADDEPYCSHNVARFRVIPEGDVVKRQGWVNATSAFTHGRFTPAEYAEREQHYGGVEIVLETWRGPGLDWEDQRIRITSDTARSLAAALIRAADIEQG
jgi:hypothetical protein